MFSRRITRILGLAFFLYAFISGAAQTAVAPLEPGHEIVTLETRPGISMKILLGMPVTAPKGTFIFFPGGSGQLVGEDGQVRQGFSGQHGTGLFAEQGFVAVLVDWPSDQASGGSDQFRASQAHTEDISKLIEFVSQKWPKPIFLIGHSLGTISAAHLAAVLKDNRLNGVVLTGSDGGDEEELLALSLCQTYPCRISPTLCSLFITGMMAVLVFMLYASNTTVSLTVKGWDLSRS